MKKILLPALFLLILTLNSCAVIGGVFKAGAVVGVVAVIIVIAVIIWVISLFRGKS